MRKFFILLIMFFGCSKQQQVEHNDDLGEPLIVSIDYIKFSLTKYTIDSDIDSIWYYPYQLLFSLSVTNNSNNTILFGAQESSNNTNAGKYGKITIANNGNIYIIGSNSLMRLPPYSKKFFLGFNTDLPIFNEVYYTGNFQRFVDQLFTNSLFFYNPILNDYFNIDNDTNDYFKLYSKPIIISADSIEVYFDHFENNDIQISKIGFPNENIPKNLKLLKPASGIEY